MGDRKLQFSILLFICLVVAPAACQISNTRDSDAIPRAEWATFDGDYLLRDDGNDFYSRYLVAAIDGHNLFNRRSVVLREDKIYCKLRDCRLHPGQHSIEIGYYWSPFKAEKKSRRKLALQNARFLAELFAGVAGDFPGDPLYYPCIESVIFTAQSDHDYVLNFVHDNVNTGPEEFQVIDIQTGTVAGSAHPSCPYRGDP